MTTLLFARDPGAANMIKAIYPAVPEAQLFAKDFARNVFRTADIEFCDFNEMLDRSLGPEDLALISAWLKTLIEERRCEFIITGTTHYDDYTDRLIWRAASDYGIRTAVILDQWYRASERFETPKGLYQPDYILTPSLEIASLLNKRKIPRKEAVFFGHPHLEHMYTVAMQRRTGRESVRAKVSEIVKRDFEVMVLLASEPQRQLTRLGLQYDGVTYDEIDLYRAVAQGMEKSQLAGELLLVKLHPKENQAQWLGVNAHLLRNEIETFDLLSAADIVVGTKSMMLLEALFFGRAVISLDFWGVSEERLVSHDCGLSLEAADETALISVFDSWSVKCTGSPAPDFEELREQLGIANDWRQTIVDLMANA